LRVKVGIRVVIAALAAALLALALPNAAAPQGSGFITVDTTRDGDDGECQKDCTLREAIAIADYNNAQYVQVPPGVYRINSPITLSNDFVFGVGLATGTFSAGARTTVVDAHGTGRVFNVAAGGFSYVAGLTITGGRAATGAGAQIPSGGQLVLYDTILKDNVATQRGGAIDNAGDVTVWTSTLEGNRVTGGNGGALAGESSSDSFVYLSTLTGNSAANGGGVASLGNVQLQRATIAGNSGGGLYSEADAGGAALWSTILAGNPGGDCGGFVTGGRGFASHNIASDGSCQFANGAEGLNSTDPGLRQLANNGGPTDTRAIPANSAAVDAGDPNLCSSTTYDQRHAADVRTCDVGAFEYGGKPPAIELPPPQVGETANVFKARGTVKIKIPGSDEFVDLEGNQQVPVGTTFDTTRGRVTLIAAANKKGKTQKAWFYQGLFKFGQSKGKKPLTTLTMTGKLQCGASGKASTALKKKRRRHLWGNGKGRFRTRGRHSAATVVGTKWLVEDRCNGTLTRVVRGTVRVRDFKKHKTIIVKAGHKYFAKR
jgi:CSLREA domain-containing protein